MANKRQKKKNLTKLKQNSKNLKKVSRKKKLKSNVSRETSKYKSNSKSAKYQEQLKLTSKKYFALLELGIDPKFLTTQNLRKVKVKDFPQGEVNKKGTKQGNINKITYPFLFEENKVTKTVKKKVKNIGEKIYKLPEGIGLYFAYMDISGEQDFEQLLARYNRKSTNDLIEKIKGLLNTLPQFDKQLYKKSKGTEGTSSGKCGVANFHLTDINTIKRLDDYDKRENSRMRNAPERKRVHSGDNRYWQTLTDDNGNIYFTEFTLHKLLVVITAIMDNIFEVDRFDFYDDVYTQVTSYFEELADVLPSPRIF